MTRSTEHENFSLGWGLIRCELATETTSRDTLAERFEVFRRAGK